MIWPQSQPICRSFGGCLVTGGAGVLAAGSVKVMRNLILCLSAGAALASAGDAIARAAILGPHADACAAGGKAAMLVKITGFKTRAGIIRVQSYGGDPARFFDKGTYLERVEVRPPVAGAAEICMPVPRGGTYAVSVRHDVQGDGKAGLSDGGGMSGNPNVSLMDVLFKRKPSPGEVAVEVRGVTVVPVVLNYVKGANVGPLGDASR